MERKWSHLKGIVLWNSYPLTRKSGSAKSTRIRYFLVNCTPFIRKLLSPYECSHLKVQYKWNISTITETSIEKIFTILWEVTAWRTEGIVSKSKGTDKLVSINWFWRWCTHSKWYKSELPVVTSGIKYLFNHGTKSLIPVWKKMVSSVCRQNATFASG